MSLHPYIVSDYLSTRSNLRACSHEVKEAVDGHPPFWNRFVYSPRTPDALLGLIRARASTMLLDLTLRISAESGLIHLSQFGWENDVELFMVRATSRLYLFFPDCRELTVEGYDSEIVDVMLQFVSSVRTNSLRTFEVVYPDPTLTDVVPSCISDFVFDTRLRPSFPPFTTFTIAPISLPITLASHMSSDICSAAVRQPVDTPLQWCRFSALLGASFSLDTLVVDGINFADVPACLVAAAPMPNLKTLDVRFRGRTSVGNALQHLNLPCFQTLIFRCDSIADLNGFLSSLPIFATRARHFHLVTGKRCHVSSRFKNLYAMLLRVELLDLSEASPQAFKAFMAASLPTHPHASSKWSGCPALTELRVTSVPLATLVQLVFNRRSVGCEDLKYLTAYMAPSLADPFSLRWFAEFAPKLVLRTPAM
ncbi:hypothetical protein C8R47DRAFT_1227353 [Mycena vitilis]|nr:hypothetical protein C8R47DRAFT_1227353 [Mycena vitilis]